MPVPGNNTLRQALRILAPQTVLYYAFLNRETTDIGTYVSRYLLPISLTGSFQFVPRNLNQDYGLEFNVVAALFYCPTTDIQDVQRNTSGDVIVFEGKQYNVESTAGDWFVTDGWVGILCIQVPNTLNNLLAIETGGIVQLENNAGDVGLEGDS